MLATMPMTRRTLAMFVVFSFAGTLPADAPEAAIENPDFLTFVRIQYSSTGGYGQSWYSYEGRDWQRWETDFPRAEKNLTFRLQQLTTLRINPEPIVLRLTDEKLFDYPFIFMSDVGWQKLSRQEKSSLARYLENGGFLWVDDFWGDAEWNNFQMNTNSLHEGWKWKTIPKNHQIMSIVYSMPECPQIPARIFYQQSRQTYDPPSVHRFPSGGRRGVSTVNFRGLFDSKGKLKAVATHNTDIADGWEREGESKEFFEKFSVNSYAMTINILTYAMTH